MIQHRVYFTETDLGYIICDSEDHAKEIQKDLDDGLAIDEVGGTIVYTGGDRRHSHTHHVINPPKAESSSY
tara:strand:+ start:72 stop:284 length:213 start_codon:yes stop_codon:yes gene_type:complete